MNKAVILALILVFILAISMNAKVEGMQKWSWYLEKNTDYSDADTIRSFTNVNMWQCHNSCISDSQCAGIVTDTDNTFNKGTCWLKSKFGTGIKKDGRYSYRMVKT
jgi:hypothetical protein